MTMSNGGCEPKQGSIYQGDVYEMPPQVEYNALQHDLQNYRELVADAVENDRWQQESFMRKRLRQVEERIKVLEKILEGENESSI